ncbi:hypothetical protein T484DRAFT_2954628 [Baffinella frigidus]|nr:hypothetical protein T484DRAFT_2954628 [Cryptophyta sp. CCMP2293]
MPTLTVVTNAEMTKKGAQDLVKALTDFIYPIAECPKEYVHAHVSHSQVVSFGSGDCETLCCHTRVVHAQELSREKKNEIAGKIQEALMQAVPTINPGSTQVLFEETSGANIAIGGAMLPL